MAGGAGGAAKTVAAEGSARKASRGNQPEQPGEPGGGARAAVGCGGRRWAAVAVLHWILASWALPALDSERLGASRAGFSHFGRPRGWILGASIRRTFRTTLGSQKHYSYQWSIKMCWSRVQEAACQIWLKSYLKSFLNPL